jgi:hypothetical protein
MGMILSLHQLFSEFQLNTNFLATNKPIHLYGLQKYYLAHSLHYGYGLEF